MLIPISRIYIDPTRTRQETWGDIEELAGLLAEHGQLFPIIVQERKDDPNFDWELDDGGRRLRALNLLFGKAAFDYELREKLTANGFTQFHVEASVKDALQGFRKKIREYVANGGRENFNWRERAILIREVHEGYTAEDSSWSVEKTAAIFSVTPKAVYDYLALTEKKEVFESPQVQEAKTFNTAKKQAKIVKANKKRELVAAYVAEREKEAPKNDGPDYFELARHVVFQGDCREWIRKLPDSSVSWIHWDPPYGTREGGGGAFPSYNGVSIDPAYCFKLMQDMLPELHRVLRDDGWLVMWSSHRTKERVLDMLRGHEWIVDETSVRCRHCKIERDGLLRIEEDYFCKGNPVSFWTNPFECLWLKTEFGNDGHEITRFLRKDTEPFFLAAKSHDPVLPFTSRGNVFSHPLPSDRRHVNHKPAGLLRDILGVVSVQGSVGLDPSVGSGSIIEAGFGSGRRVLGAELVEDNWINSVAVTAKVLQEKNINNLSWSPLCSKE